MRETDELLLKLMVTLARDRRAMQGRVRSVGFMREYLTLPEQLGVHTLTEMNEQDIEQLAHSVSIKRKSDAAHFHFYLNDVRYRLLQIVQKQVVIVENINADQWQVYEQHAAIGHTLLPHLGASTKLTKLPSEEIKQLLDYMLFYGTENGRALHCAEGLFLFEDALNMNSWTIMTKEQALTYIIEHGEITIIQGEQPKLSLHFIIS